jgi:hypothetical protein
MENNQTLTDSFRALLSASPRVGPSPLATGSLEGPSPHRPTATPRVVLPSGEFMVLPLPEAGIPLTPSYNAIIHLALASLHEEGRIARLDDAFHREAEKEEEKTPPSYPCAWFHLQKAAHLGLSAAQLAVAAVFANMPRDHLRQVDCEDRDLANKVWWHVVCVCVVVCGVCVWRYVVCACMRYTLVSQNVYLRRYGGQHSRFALFTSVALRCSFCCLQRIAEAIMQSSIVLRTRNMMNPLA